MLPFLKERHEGAMANAEEDVLTRKSDKPEEYGMLDAIAEDMLSAIQTKNKKLLKEALEAFAEHLQDKDEEQDAEDFK